MISTPARRWRTLLEALAVPERILAHAPQSPYGFDARHFSRVADAAAGATNPAVAAAAEALPAGGSVLDVGCGAGAACLPLLGRAGAVIGVDERGDMLDALRERTGDAADLVTTQGRWPDVADTVAAADVVVCRNVLYNVPDVEPFVLALTAHARRRVVVELTAAHPLAWMGPYWRELHGLHRSPGPTADDALAAVEALGLRVAAARWETRWLLAGEDEDTLVAFLLRRLCLPPARAPEVRRLLARHPPPRQQPTVGAWWDGTANG